MGFEELVSDDPPPSREELERLKRVIREYEAENVRLRDERDVAQNTYEGVLEGKEHAQKEKNELHKKINSLKQQLMIEKKASEGLTKKAGMLDIDLKLHKEERKSLVDEQILNRRKVADLEKKLLDDRAKRLRNIHENDILRKRNLELEARNKICEVETKKASEDLLVKIQKLQSATELVDKQRRTIEAQGAEMLELNREITTLKEAMKSMTDDFLKLERRSAAFKKDRDEFEHENFRLRREMVTTASSTSRRAAAFDGFRPTSKQSSQRASTSIGGSRGGSTITHGAKPSTAGGFADTHSFQFADWDSMPAGQRRSLSPALGVDGRSHHRAMTTGGHPRGRRDMSLQMDGQGEGASVAGELSQMTLDSAMAGMGETAETRGETEGKLRQDDVEELDESSDTFATAALSVHSHSPMAQSLGPAAASGASSPSSSHGRGGGGSGKGGKNRKRLTVDTSYTSTSAPLRPLTGTSPLPSPMGSPSPQGPLAAAGALSPVFFRAGSSSSSAGRKSAGGRGALLSQPRGKLHERGRTGFVGQGLGMVASPTPSYSAGGSAKQVLARILAES